MPSSSITSTKAALPHRELLLALRWLGALTKEQMHALCFPKHKAAKTVERAITGLVNHTPSLLTRSSAYAVPSPGMRPIRLPFSWAISPEGAALLQNDPQYPRVGAGSRIGPRTAPEEQDKRALDLLLALLLAGRRVGLYGVFLQHRLPRSPATSFLGVLLRMELSGVPAEETAIPWSNAIAADGEHIRSWAIEIDPVLSNKSEARVRWHRALWHDPPQRAAWEAQYGSPPLSLWLTANLNNLRMIRDDWQRLWPDGFWLGITHDLVQPFTTPLFTLYRGGTVIQRGTLNLTPTCPAFRQGDAVPDILVPIADTGRWETTHEHLLALESVEPDDPRVATEVRALATQQKPLPIVAPQGASAHPLPGTLDTLAPRVAEVTEQHSSEPDDAAAAAAEATIVALRAALAALHAQHAALQAQHEELVTREAAQATAIGQLHATQEHLVVEALSAYRQLAEAQATQQQYVMAVAMAKRAIGIAEQYCRDETADQHHIGHCLMTLAAIEQCCGAWSQSRSSYTRALAIFQQMPDWADFARSAQLAISTLGAESRSATTPRRSVFGRRGT